MTLWFKRGLRYTGVGFATFVLDLALLFFFIDALNLNILFSTGLAFIGALTLNFIVSKRYVFLHSDRKDLHAYLYFIGFALLGMAVTVVLMWVFVSFTALHFAISRMVIALIVGFGNYYANLFLNFKVAGVHLKKEPPTGAAH